MHSMFVEGKKEGGSDVGQRREIILTERNYGKCHKNGSQTLAKKLANQNHLEGLLKHTAGPIHKAFESVGLVGSLRTCISNAFPGDADAAGLRPHFENHWIIPSPPTSSTFY